LDEGVRLQVLECIGMSNLSRREFGGAALAAVVGAILPSSAKAIQTESPERQNSVEKQLKVPLTDEAKKLLSEAMKGVSTASQTRLRFPLPDCSEPCTVYVPTEDSE